MILKVKVFILSILLCSTYAQNCQLQLYSANQQNFYDLSYGVILGLHHNSPSSCPLCNTFGNIFSSIQVAFVNVESLRTTWTDQNKINAMSIASRVTTLITLYNVFQKLGIEILNLYQNNDFRTFMNKVTTRFDYSFHNNIAVNVTDHLNELFLLL